MGKELRADIVIGGQADGSLYTLGASIEALGQQLNAVSQKLIDFGKDSLTNYTEFEDAMLDARVALATTYTNVSDLDRVMQQLETHAYQWASSTRFTTVDVANAIDNAAHAGWNFEQIMEAIPSAMEIAMAGSMDLSDALNMMIRISNAAGIEFTDLGSMIDVWSFAANKSATTIPEMGEAMQRMGATMQFVGGDMAALTTMLAILANNGATGSEAGTLLRNSMIRLIAPTQRAAEAMEGLNLQGDELGEIYGDPEMAEMIEQAGALLEQAGFSAYNADGSLKSFMDIWTDLAQAMEGMSDQQRNTVLSAIFPTRTITGAMALLEAASNGWNGLYDSIMQDSAGYAAFAAQTMESGLGGAMRHMESQWDTLMTKTGGALSGDASAVTGFITDLIAAVNGMDEASFAGLVGGLEVLAVSGTGLITAGVAIKTLGALFGTGAGGWILLGLTGLASLLYAIAKLDNALSEEAFAGEFGANSFDETALGRYLSTIGDTFDAAYEKINGYNSEIDLAFANYERYTQDLNRQLMTSLVTGAELTEEDKQKLLGLGQDIEDSIVEGIRAQQRADAEQQELLRGTAEGVLGDDMWEAIMDTLGYGYDDAIARANAMGEGLSGALTDAFADGTLTAEELAKIQGFIDSMNMIAADRLEADNAAARARLMQKGQALGLSGMESAAAMVTAERDRILAEMEDTYYGPGGSRSSLHSGGMAKIRNGVTKEDGTPYTQADLDAELAAYDSAYLRSVGARTMEYNSMTASIFEQAMQQSDLLGKWGALKRYARDGAITDEEFEGWITSTTWDERKQIGAFMKSMWEALGGKEGIEKIADYYDSIGLAGDAEYFRGLIPMMALAEAGDYTDLVLPGYFLDDAILWTRRNYGVSGEAPVGADVTPAEEEIDALNGRIITVNVAVGSALTGRMGKFAEGGRADVMSIFGEAGPEWAIPEEHSDRTAQLLSAAALASGFTWPELLSRNGGLNSGSGSGWTMVYQPTIHSGKGRRQTEGNMDSWMRDKTLHDELEVYA